MAAPTPALSMRPQNYVAEAALNVCDLVPTDTPPAGMFAAIFQALEATTLDLIGPSTARLLVIPIHDEAGAVAGGLWGVTAFEWLHLLMLVVPAPVRGRGIGTALMQAAEAEALRRGCRGVHVDAFSFQGAPFYRKLGYTAFGVLHDSPPGHQRIYFSKRLVPNPELDMSGVA